LSLSPDGTPRPGLAVEPGHSPAQEADGRALLLVSEDLDVGQPCGIFDRYVGPVIADARGVSLLPIAGVAMSDLVDAGQLFDVDMNRLPVLSNSKRCTGALGSRFRNRPRPRWFRVLPRWRRERPAA